MTLLALVPLFWIIGYVILKGGQSINLAFFTQLPRPLGVAGGGVLHAIEGHPDPDGLGRFICHPAGCAGRLLCGLSSQYPAGHAVRFGTDVLSGVPSIVIGIFGYALIVKPAGHYLGPGRRGGVGDPDAAHHHPHHRGNDQAGAA